jgi:hypothetical protein
MSSGVVNFRSRAQQLLNLLLTLSTLLADFTVNFSGGNVNFCRNAVNLSSVSVYFFGK